MALTKSKGNMYSWVTHVWSPIKGCQFECDYCYAKKYGYGTDVELDQEDLNTHLGRGKIIFVGHLSDMWGAWVPQELIQKVINHCLDYPENEYVFQSKNPGRFMDFKPQPNFLYGTTIETDEYPLGFKTKAPAIRARFAMMKGLAPARRRFVTIEPIMDFHVGVFVGMISAIRPEFVTIGADSKGHGLVEPSWEKVQELINTISKFTEIRQKTNLDRLKIERPKVKRVSRE